VEPQSPPTRISNLVGLRLGPYEVVDLIGRGGMAVVYKGLQPSLHRHVAIKVLPAYLAAEPDFRARFQREAEIIARLEHPNILPIYDYGQEGDIPYIVMPLIRGGTLRDWLELSRPLDRVVPVLSRTLSALHYAHTRKPAIIHRDIKPANILMGEGDWPLLSDFGIAKIVEPSLRLTVAGMLVGTPEYMAPEQSEGETVDARADVYAAGVILFQVLSGRLPFQGRTPARILLEQLRQDVPSPRSIRPELSPVWDEVIRRSLARNPDDRYPSAEAMNQALQAAWTRVQQESSAGPAAIETRTSPADRAAQLALWGDAALKAERFSEARAHYEEALQLVANYEEALRGLDRVQQAQSLAGLYYAARADIAAERWDAAAVKLEQIAAVEPAYHDVEALRRMVDGQRHPGGRVREDRWQPAPRPPAQAAGPPPSLSEPGVPRPTVPRPMPAGQSSVDAGPAPSTRTVQPDQLGALRPRPHVATGPTGDSAAAPETSAPGAVVAIPPPPERGHKRKPLLLAGLVAVVAGIAFMTFQSIVNRSDSGVVDSRVTPALTATAGEPTATAVPTAADLFPACETAVNAADWAEAAGACEKVQEKDANYPGLASALATAYVGLGKDRLAQGQPVSEALDYFQRALAAKPDDAEAAQQQAWATAFQDGDAALASGDWPTAAGKFQEVYAAAPDYLENSSDGGVKTKLLTTWLGWGDALLQSGQYAEARRRCEQALELVPDSAEATSCVQAAVAALATPTPAPHFTQPAPQAPPANQRPPQAPAAQPARPAPPPQAPAAQPPAAQPARPVQPAQQPARPAQPPQQPAPPPPAVPTRPPVVGPPTRPPS